MGRRRARASGSRDQGSMIFETMDDGLAAFLLLRGCRWVGTAGREVSRPRVVHVFDDQALRLVALVDAYRRGEADAVSALQFAQALRHLRTVRRDERLRLHRERVPLDED